MYVILDIFCQNMCTYDIVFRCNKVSSKHILPVARPDPEVVAMLTSGLTASISLEKVVTLETISFYVLVKKFSFSIILKASTINYTIYVSLK